MAAYSRPDCGAGGRSLPYRRYGGNEGSADGRQHLSSRRRINAKTGASAPAFFLPTPATLPAGDPARWRPCPLATLPAGDPARWRPFPLATLPAGDPARWRPCPLATLPAGDPSRWRPYLFNARLFNARLFNARLFNARLFNARLFNAHLFNALAYLTQKAPCHLARGEADCLIKRGLQ